MRYRAPTGLARSAEGRRAIGGRASSSGGGHSGQGKMLRNKKKKKVKYRESEIDKREPWERHICGIDVGAEC